MATTGHLAEAVNVQGMKAALQKFKTEKVDHLGLTVVDGQLCQTYTE